MFFQKCQDRGTCVTGLMLINLAKQKANELAIEGFSGSDCWITGVKARNDIVSRVLSGESKSVNKMVLQNWTGKLPGILQGYRECDVYNTDETGLFFKTCSNKSLLLRGDDAHGAKTSKDRVTLLLTCSWAGEKIKPILIWKSKSPRVLKGANKDRYQTKAWMVGNIFEEYLLWF